MEKKFVLTFELGRLTTWLRILGFDAAYCKGADYLNLLIQAFIEKRIILTKNKRLAKRTSLKTFYLRQDQITEQVQRVLARFNLSLDPKRMFSRCVLCNKRIEKIEKEKVKGRVPKHIFNTGKDFKECPECKRIYWLGTHRANVERVVQKLKQNKTENKL